MPSLEQTVINNTHMKKFLLVCLLFLVPFFCRAQISYGATYNRYNENLGTSSYSNGSIYNSYSGNSSYKQSQPSPQVTSITAYALDGSGNVVKMRIKVSAVSNGYSETLKVTEYYNTSTFGNQWFKMGTPATVFKCSSYGNPLEQNFMYKVNIAGKGTWYFDY